MIGFGQCFNPCDVTWHGDGNLLDGTCYEKYNMEAVNGCIEIKDWTTTGHKRYTNVKHKLIIKNGKLIDLMSWHDNNQLKQIIKSYEEGKMKIPSPGQCYDRQGQNETCFFLWRQYLSDALKNPNPPCE